MFCFDQLASHVLHEVHYHIKSVFFFLLQAVDQKKEEFQRYLEKSGVLDSITRMLVALDDMPEKPEDARDFIREFLTGTGPTETQVLQAQVERLTREVCFCEI